MSGILAAQTAGQLAGAATSLLGGIYSADQASREARKDREMQREFAQHGIQWKVADAKAAGIHPLAALGVTPTQATPVHVGADPGRAVSGFGQDIMRISEGMKKQSEVEKQIEHDTMRKASFDADASLYQSMILKNEAFKGRPGTENNPIPLFKYYKDQHSGKVLLSPDSEFAEGGEGFAGRAGFTYGNVRAHGTDFFEEEKK